MSKIKLSSAQKEALSKWREYPNSIDMNLQSGHWLTGGHGIKIDGRIMKSFIRNGLVKNHTLTDLGKTIEL